MGQNYLLVISSCSRVLGHDLDFWAPGVLIFKQEVFGSGQTDKGRLEEDKNPFVGSTAAFCIAMHFLGSGSKWSPFM